MDNPKVMIYDKYTLSEELKNALVLATEEYPNIRSKMKFRECYSCYCHSNYLRQISQEQLSRLFLPQEHEKYPD